MVIWKYQIGTATIQDLTHEIEMPKGAKIIHAHSQDEIPYVWASVDPDAPIEMRYFYVVGTGQAAPDGRYVGTVHQYNGAYVWHIFEVW